MKKMKFIVMLAVATVIGFASCDKKTDEDPVGPSISFTSAGDYTKDATIPASESFEIVTLLSAGDVDLKSFNVVKTESNNPVTILDTTIKGKTVTIPLTITPGTENFTVKFTVTDKDGLQDTKTLKFTVTGSGDIKIYSAKLMGAQSNSKYGSAFASSNGNVYTKANAKTNASLVDMIYYFNTTDATVAAEVISPKFAETSYTSYVDGWTTKNATKFTGKLSTDFSSITSGSAISTAVGTPDQDRITSLVIGDVFGFETAAGKQGLAKVTGFATGAAGSLTIEVKVQE